jgi:hypothetical protein
MRVNERKAVLGPRVMGDEMLQECALPGPGFPENMTTESPVIMQDAEDAVVVAEIDAREESR